MTQRDRILDTLRQQHVLLSGRYPIRRLALFGSWARDEAREDSDVDVLVEDAAPVVDLLVRQRPVLIYGRMDFSATRGIVRLAVPDGVLASSRIESSHLPCDGG